MAIKLKTASDLTEAARTHIAKKNFALTGGQSDTGKPAYPIHDRAHAKAALGMVGMHGTSEQKAEVRRDVAQKYPEMLKKAGALPSPGIMGRLRNTLTGATDSGMHANELAGLGVLAIPGLDHLQAQGRAMFAGDDSPEAIEHRRLFGEGTHALMDVGGLGLLAAPAAHHLLSAKHAMVDELLKIGAVSDEQAEHAINRLDTLDRNKPTLGQVGRYAAFGAVAAPAVTAASNLVKGRGLSGGLKGMTHLRDIAGDAAKGAIGSGLLPLAQREMDRRAEESTLRDYLSNNNELREYVNGADKIAGFLGSMGQALTTPIPGTGKMPVIGGIGQNIQKATQASAPMKSPGSGNFADFQKNYRSTPAMQPAPAFRRTMGTPPPMAGRGL